MTWSLPLALDPSDALPTFLQISRTVAREIRRGRLRPGDRLPSSRRLARTLGVHRNTVLAAYAELAAEGWIVTEAARGTFVSTRLPEVRPQRRQDKRGVVATSPAFALPPAAVAPPDPALPAGVLALTGGMPDVGLVPVAALARAYRRALHQQGGHLLDYGDPAGHPRLRTAIRSMLAAARGVVAEDDQIIVTRGSQMGIYLLARSLLGEGRAVAVEAYGYRPAWEAFRSAGARLVPIPVDAEGLRVDDLRAALAEHDCRAVYLTPHHQFPTTVMLSPGRRLELLQVAREHRLAIIEDDYDHEFHYEGRPVLPLASVDTAGVVIYVGTLSKVLAPGLRVGYVVAPPQVIRRLVALRTYVDRVGDQGIEVAVAELIEDGELERHTNRARRIYEQRRAFFTDALKRRLGEVLSFDLPPGGMALWAKVDRRVHVEAWARRALDGGVAIAPAGRFAFDGRRRPFVRLGFARVAEAELAHAVEVLARTARGR